MARHRPTQTRRPRDGGEVMAKFTVYEETRTERFLDKAFPVLFALFAIMALLGTAADVYRATVRNECEAKGGVPIGESRVVCIRAEVVK